MSCEEQTAGADRTVFTINDRGDVSFNIDGATWLSGNLNITPSGAEHGGESHEKCGTSYTFASADYNCLVDCNIKHPDSGVYFNCISFEARRHDFAPQLRVSLAEHLWYGAGELHEQRWPMNDVTMHMQPFVTNDIVPLRDTLGNVIERYWISSKGVGIYVHEDTPLWTSFNQHNSKQLYLKAEFSPPYVNIDSSLPKLEVSIIKADNVKLVHTYMSGKYFSRPNGVPDTRMIKSPIWSTWARFKVNVDQQKVLDYADEILHHGFSNSQIEIDDMYSTHYGEFDFTSVKFPDPKGMITKLKQNGFRTTVWVTPFANLDSPTYTIGMDNSYWLKNRDGSAPAHVHWWQGTGATLDVSNPDAASWYLKRLDGMRAEFGVDSFKFDAGEVTYLPPHLDYLPKQPWRNPCEYTTKYVDVVSRAGTMIEVRCGYRSQQHPVFVRMCDKESRWGYDNGLQTIIPTALTFGLLGYPYVLPDMIGGNGYAHGDDNPFVGTTLPDRELFIRWLQLTAYLPAMQFSFVPWQYDNEVVEIAREFVRIHEEIVTPILLQAAAEAQQAGTPLIRPLWWIAPEDSDALNIDTEFLVGDSLLVAPILEKGAVDRSIYLPAGVWNDELRGCTVKGPQWLYDYKASIRECPVFRKILD